MTKSAELAYWINERYEMKLRKDLGTGITGDFKFGYSNDPHMGLVRYCNVHREDDKVTKWLAKNWRPNHHAVWEIVLARMINYIPSLAELMHRKHNDDVAPLDRPSVVYSVAQVLKERRDGGQKVFTSAYTISTCGQSMDKIDYVMGVVEAVKSYEGKWVPKFMGLKSTWDSRTLAEAHFVLTRINGLGSFLAAQVIADLKNTAGHPLQDAPDWHTWAAPGPGSLKGLEEYFGRRVTPRTFVEDINECWHEVKPLVNPHVPPIHMQDFQNCLCEFSKFERVKKGGHVRNKYRPGQD